MVRSRSATVLLVAALLSPPAGFTQPQMLDDFEHAAGWQPVTSEGSFLTIAVDSGREGKSMRLDFQLNGGYSHVIARKSFPLTLPENFQFVFDLKGEARPNNFEFKLIDSLGNVFWLKRLNMEFPREWNTMRIKKDQITFAWGPSGGGSASRVAQIEFVVSAAEAGKGSLWIDDFRLEPIGSNGAPKGRPSVVISPASASAPPRINSQGDTVWNWRGIITRKPALLTINFARRTTFGGLVLDWGKNSAAVSYAVQSSADGRAWSELYRVVNGNGGRDYVPTPGGDAKFVRIAVTGGQGKSFTLTQLVIRPLDFSATPNGLFSAMAADAPPGNFPSYYRGILSFWTTVGVPGDNKEALLNDCGALEVEPRGFTLEPFLRVGGKLHTWSDAARSQTLENGYLPVPSVEWGTNQRTRLKITSFAAGDTGHSVLFVTYMVTNGSLSRLNGNLFVALRPFQVNPPSQAVLADAGYAPVDSIEYRRGVVYADRKKVIPLSPPDGFGASAFDDGDISEYLSAGTVPPRTAVRDHMRAASAAMMYGLDLAPGDSARFSFVVPFYEDLHGVSPGHSRDSAAVLVERMHDETVRNWKMRLDKVGISVPPRARAMVNTMKSNLAYILVNQDGPGIQPGSRAYNRSFMRDGALTCTALLMMGIREPVMAFVDWYAQYQFPNGAIPCIVDSRGPEPVPEHDSHGEFIYLVLQYYQFSGDTAWLRGKWSQIVKTVRHIQALRAERKTELYKAGDSVQRACYGLVPESISHEGYWSRPMHSYWDDFFVLRGLKDAVTIARVLGQKEESEFAAERDDFSACLERSIQLAMSNARIDYIPGCVELGDFDATSTAISILPGGEAAALPHEAVQRTFDRYFQSFVQRRDGVTPWENYTPYEVRIIGALVLLGKKEEARALTEFFLNDRRPAGWNQWPEVVWHNTRAVKFIGDMPHTWVGSDFIRSVRSMFAYEREGDSSLVLAAGVQEEWLEDSRVSVTEMPTLFGPISYSMCANGKNVIVELSGNTTMTARRIRVTAPRKEPPRAVMVNGKPAQMKRGNEIDVDILPSHVEFQY